MNALITCVGEYALVCVCVCVYFLLSLVSVYFTNFFRIAYTRMHIHINYSRFHSLTHSFISSSLSLLLYTYICSDMLTEISLYLSQLQLPMQSGKDLEQHLFLVFRFFRVSAILHTLFCVPCAMKICVCI